MRITVACPEAMRDDANHFAMCLAFSEADANTYGALNWKDADGNLYAAASFIASEQWIAGAQKPLQRPTWDAGEVIDMNAAERAQATLMFITEVMPASPVALTAIGGMDGPAALQAMGLTTIEADNDDGSQEMKL